VADAAMRGDLQALRAAIARKADVNAPQPDGSTALHWAVERDDLQAADLLIKAGARVTRRREKA
jgi:ankyrin repeat protein